MRDLQPILATLKRHQLIATLLALLVALTCATVCNVAFMVQQQVSQVNLPSGVAENQVVVVQSTDLNQADNHIVRHRADLAVLRMIPGVKAAAAIDSLPLGQSGASGGSCASEQALMREAQAGAIVGNCVESAFYEGTPGMVSALGLRLIAGRTFRADEFMNGMEAGPPAVIVTRAFAKKMYPGGSALGKTLYADPGHPARIVGIVDNVLRHSLHGPGQNYLSVIWPNRPDSASVTYILRTTPQDRERVLRRAKTVLYQLDPNRVIRHAVTYEQVRAHYFQGDHTMISLLLASVLGLMLVAALGITGLANFWVQQRTRTIGIRRALGATRGDILRYFQTENFLIVTLGVVVGVLLAVGLNLLLMSHYQLPRLPLWYLPMGAAALWILGQLAVLAPALRASHVPPAVATRL